MIAIAIRALMEGPVKILSMGLCATVQQVTVGICVRPEDTAVPVIPVLMEGLVEALLVDSYAFV